MLLPACERKEGVRAYDAPKDAPPVAVRTAWTVPATWKSVPPGPMTYAAYQVENSPLKMTVSQVTAMASGSATVLANVNRWERQLGLPQSPESEMSKLATPIKLEGREGLLVDLTAPKPAADGGPQLRMLGALVPDGDQVWAFKMSGPAEQVAAQKESFEAVVKSFHPDVAGEKKEGGDGGVATTPNPSPTPSDNTAPAAAGGGKIAGIADFTLPAGWQIDARPRPMREATIVVPPAGGGNAPGEIVVSRLSPNSLADLLPNLNRWRGQVHLAPTNDNAANPGQPISLGQGPAVIRDFEGPDAEGNGRLRQYVAYTQFPGATQTWFFRFVGPYDLVTRSKPEFESFVKSLKFDEK